MNAAPLLVKLARQFSQVKLEAILVGNAAAALHGSPVTTIDFDFMFRDTPQNLRKLRALTDRLGGVLLRPYYPASKLYRLVSDREGLQVDFMPRLDGIRSFASLRSRAVRLKFNGHAVLVADLRDIIKSKRSAGRAQDKAVLPILEQTLHEKEKLNQ